ncbi:MFS transporter [Prosthecomicrobium sp. N25]|uniref:MFS transporter n=1 Tax=Prosthecomicrobium sp. N25 TaxID=3129254 RepID=UPI0030774E97
MTAPAEDFALPQRSRLVSATVAVAFFIQMLDGTIIATSLPQMAESFGTDAVAMSSGFTVYMLTAAVLMPPAGWLADRFGARRVFLAALAAFTAASVACGLSNSLAAFLAARALQGAGAALLAPVGRLIVLRSAAKQDLVHAIATITWPALFAPVIGPVLGSWITVHVGWQWNFFVNLPLGLVGIGLIAAFVPADRPEPVGRFDTVGFLASAGGLSLMLVGLELFVGRHGPEALSLGLALAGTLLGAAAIRHLLRTPQPLLDLSVFRVETFAVSTLTAGTFCRLAINATPFLLPLLFQVGFGAGAVEAGAMVFVYFLGNLAMKSVTTPMLRWFGFRTILVVNGILSAISIGLFAAVGAGTPQWLVALLLFAAGATRSLQFTALNTLAFADVEGPRRSAASTLAAILQQLSMLIGIALAVAVVRIAGILRSSEIYDPAATGTETLATLADFRAAFLVVAALGILASLRFVVMPRHAGAEVSGHGR